MSFSVEKRSNTDPVLLIIQKLQNKSIEACTEMLVFNFVKEQFKIT